MADETLQKPGNDSVLAFVAQLWAAAASFRAYLHPHLKADFILANPPSNMCNWRGEILRKDMRCKFGRPPVNDIGLNDSVFGVKTKGVRSQRIGYRKENTTSIQ